MKKSEENFKISLSDFSIIIFIIIILRIASVTLAK